MALQLGKYALYGEIHAKTRNKVYGWIALEGMDQVIQLDLSGNCEPDLAGKNIRFRAKKLPKKALNQDSARTLQVRQIGATGKITAELKTQLDSVGQPIIPSLNTPKGKGKWRPMLHLEWFSQNGRMVIAMADPVIQTISRKNEGEAAADAFFDELYVNEPEVDSTPDNPLALSPDKENPEDIAKSIREMELMDDLIEFGVGESLVSMLDGGVSLPDPATLNENQAETILRVMLAKLALFHVSLDICEHMTALETYKMFLEHIAPEADGFREMAGTGWVQHYSTHEHCEICQEEFERDWEDSNGDLLDEL